MSPRPRHRLAWLAVVLEVALSLGAIGGGTLFLVDPSGALMGMRPEALHGTPFRDYRQAGVLLLLVHGVGPWIAVLAEARRLAWSHLAHLVVAGALLVWMGVQLATMGLIAPVQGVMVLQGITMAIVASALVWSASTPSASSDGPVRATPTPGSRAR